MNGFTPVDSWVAAKLLADRHVNGELALVSEPNRRLAQLMATMQHQEMRAGGFLGFTAGSSSNPQGCRRC